MEEWEIYLATAAIILGIFCFFAIIVCVFRRKRHEKLMSNLIQTRYSVGSRYSFLSFSAVPWRWSTVTTASAIQPINEVSHCQRNSNIRGHFTEPRSNFNPQGSTPATQNSNCRINSNNQSTRPSRSSGHLSMTLEIIKEYEEKESELGLGGNANGEEKK